MHGTGYSVLQLPHQAQACSKNPPNQINRQVEVALHTFASVPPATSGASFSQYTELRPPDYVHIGAKESLKHPNPPNQPQSLKMLAARTHASACHSAAASRGRDVPVLVLLAPTTMNCAPSCSPTPSFAALPSESEGPCIRRRRARPQLAPCRTSTFDQQRVIETPPALSNGHAVTPGANGVAPPAAPQTTPAPSYSSALADGVTYDGIIAEVATKPSSLYVRVRSMVKHFNTAKGVFKAVDGVDVDIEPSSIVALLGPSGSGKTTLLRLISGLESPTGGKILFDDFDATNTPVQDRQIGMVFQNYALFNHKTVAENIKFGLEVRKLKIDHNARVQDLLELVQLDGLGDRFPKQLSGGQRQRVALARSLASNPRLLLLDEPFGALDAVVRKSLRSGLKEIVRSVGVTTIIVTHDQEEAFDLADKVVVFNRGRIEQAGTPNEIIKTPKTPFIMKFVGDTNIVPSTSQLLRKIGFYTPKSLAMFRPSDMIVSKVVSDNAPAMVAERHNLGWTVRYQLRFDDGVEVEYLVTRDMDEKQYNLDVGQRVYVALKPEAVMGFEMNEIDSAPIL